MASWCLWCHNMLTNIVRFKSWGKFNTFWWQEHICLAKNRHNCNIFNKSILRYHEHLFTCIAESTQLEVHREHKYKCDVCKFKSSWMNWTLGVARKPLFPNYIRCGVGYEYRTNYKFLWKKKYNSRWQIFQVQVRLMVDVMVDTSKVKVKSKKAK